MRKIAGVNLEALKRNPYPGRGIVIGQDDTNTYLIQAYWIMGRSGNSRNRVFDQDAHSGRVFTEAADPAKVQDPSLIIYNAMVEANGAYVVSNGHQTDAIARTWYDGGSLCHVLSHAQGWRYEPDAPNYTPRISAIAHRDSTAQFAILRKSAASNACDRFFYDFADLSGGFGFCVTTYSGDGDPLPAFQGEPYPLPLEGDIDAVTATLWATLNPANRVSLAVKFVHLLTGERDVRIVNQYAKVG